MKRRICIRVFHKQRLLGLAQRFRWRNAGLERAFQ